MSFVVYEFALGQPRVCHPRGDSFTALSVSPDWRDRAGAPSGLAQVRGPLWPTRPARRQTGGQGTAPRPLALGPWVLAHFPVPPPRGEEEEETPSWSPCGAGAVTGCVTPAGSHTAPGAPQEAKAHAQGGPLQCRIVEAKDPPHAGGAPSTSASLRSLGGPGLHSCVYSARPCGAPLPLKEMGGRP